MSHWSGVLQQNRTTEMDRNKERFQFLKWVDSAFKNVTVIPPGTGVMHRVNLEYLVSPCLSCLCSMGVSKRGGGGVNWFLEFRVLVALYQVKSSCPLKPPPPPQKKILQFPVVL